MARNSSKTKAHKSPVQKGQLTGKHVLLILLATFGVIFAVNGYFLVKAVSSFPGEDVPRSYLQGIEYNKTLKSRAVQNAAGWSAGVNTVKTQTGARTLIIQIKDRNDRPINALEVTAVLRHPTNAALDKTIALPGYGDGKYRAEIANAGAELSGKWGLVASAKQGEFVFTLTQDLWMK